MYRYVFDFLELQKKSVILRKKQMKVSGIKAIPYTTEMSILNLENIYIDINVENEPAEITLPKIAEMDQKNVKFYVNLDSNFELNHPATILPADGDTINGLSEIVLNVGDRGFWVLVQDESLWSMASSNFVPSSFLGFNATIKTEDGGFSSIIENGVPPFTYLWTLPHGYVQGFEISGPANESTVSVIHRTGVPPSSIATFESADGFVIRPSMVKLEVRDAIGAVSKDFAYIMTSDVV